MTSAAVLSAQLERYGHLPRDQWESDAAIEQFKTERRTPLCCGGLGGRLLRVFIDKPGGITVDETDWILREFDTPGTVEWSWSIMATQLEDATGRSTRPSARPTFPARPGARSKRSLRVSRTVSPVTS